MRLDRGLAMGRDEGGAANVSHHGGGQPFPSWTDACRGCSVQPNPSFSHTVSGLWLERDSRERGGERGDKSGEGKRDGGALVFARHKQGICKGTCQAFLPPSLPPRLLLCAHPPARHTRRAGGGVMT